MKLASDRVIGLDLLRGLCSIAVVLYHFLSWRFRWPIESAGAFAVYTFFILSGLTMMMVYGRRFSRCIDAELLKTFFVARAARLLPMLVLGSIMTLAIMVVFLDVDPQVELVRTLLTSTALFSLSAPALLSNVTGGWSLGIEGMFYLLFPTLAVLSANAGGRTLVAWAIVTFIAQQITSLLILRTGVPFWYFYVSPLTFAPFFLLGMAISRAEGARSRWWLAISLMVLAVICVFSIAAPQIDIYSTPWAYTLLTVLSAIAVLAAFRAAIPTWLAPIASFLGEISYSLYLTHWITYVLAGQIAEQLGWGAYWESLLFALIAVAFAYAAHRIVEVPARKLIKGASVRAESLPVTLP